MTTTAFVYKWTQKSTGKWYIGSRTAKTAHPDDGYLCSSKIVKPMIKENPDDWSRQVLCIGHPQDMYELECKLLVSYDAAHDDMSYNRHNGGKNFCRTGKTGELCHMYGKKRSDETRAKIGVALSGKPRPDDTRAKLSAVQTGKTGEKAKAYKGIILATNRSNGEMISIIGGKRQLKELGFTPSAVSQCILGKAQHHKNYTFQRPLNNISI